MSATKKDAIAFTFGATEVRTVLIDGLPWFNANDVCAALELSNPRDAIANHVDPEDVAKRDTLTAGGKQRQNHVNESGLYALIFGSTKDSARKFKRWVTSEVLPSIRKTGQYQADWRKLRHSAASSSKVQDAMLQEVRKAIGKATQPYHFANEHRLINSLLTGEYKGLDRNALTAYQLDFLAHFEVRNALLIGLGLTYEQRKGALKAEALDWSIKHAEQNALATV